MKQVKVRGVFLAGFLLSYLACGPKVLVPPAVDLKVYDSIGLVRFSSNVEGNLEQFATQKFLQEVQSGQPGVRILELGNENEVLESVEHNQLNVEAIRALGKKYKVDAILTGNLEVSDVKPKVNLSTLVKSMSARAEVEASLTARLFETDTGATLWTNSGNRKETVGHVTVMSDGPAHFDARDPESAYGKLIDGLVNKVTEDFRAKYVRR